MEGAVFRDALGLAGNLEEVLTALEPFDQSSIKGIIHRKPPGGLGKFEWIEAVGPPIDMSEIANSLKTRFGGGDYRLTIFAAGKTRKVIEFPIMSDPHAAVRPAAPANDQTGNASDRMFAMMFQMQEQARRDASDQAAESRREALEHRREMEERQARRDDNLYKMIGIAVPIVAPLLLGKKDSIADQVALFTALKGDSNSLKETAEMMLTFKKLFGEDKTPEGFNPDDIVGSLARIAGPAAAAVGRAFGGGRPGVAAAGPEEGAPAGGGQLYLEDASAAQPPAAPPIIAAAPPGAQPTNPLLRLIGPHVLYAFAAQLPPSLAADNIVAIMDRANVRDEDVDQLATAFALSADWKADLAAQGIDLRSNAGWADEFLSELVAAWTGGDRDGDSAGGGGGGVGDADGDAAPGEGGLHLNGGAGQGA